MGRSHSQRRKGTSEAGTLSPRLPGRAVRSVRIAARRPAHLHAQLLDARVKPVLDLVPDGKGVGAQDVAAWRDAGGQQAGRVRSQRARAATAPWQAVGTPRQAGRARAERYDTGHGAERTGHIVIGDHLALHHDLQRWAATGRESRALMADSMWLNTCCVMRGPSQHSSAPRHSATRCSPALPAPQAAAQPARRPASTTRQSRRPSWRSGPAWSPSSCSRPAAAAAASAASRHRAWCPGRRNDGSRPQRGRMHSTSRCSQVLGCISE
jgi:hypothetical protein